MQRAEKVYQVYTAFLLAARGAPVHTEVPLLANKRDRRNLPLPPTNASGSQKGVKYADLCLVGGGPEARRVVPFELKQLKFNDIASTLMAAFAHPQLHLHWTYRHGLVPFQLFLSALRTQQAEARAALDNGLPRMVRSSGGPPRAWPFVQADTVLERPCQVHGSWVLVFAGETFLFARETDTGLHPCPGGPTRVDLLLPPLPLA
jgi:hypothetical protein